MDITFFTNWVKGMSRLSCFLLGLFYAWFYDFIFVHYIVDLFGAFYVPMSVSQSLNCFFVGAFPLLFYRGLNNNASVFSFFYYVFVYVPFNESLCVCGWTPEFNDYRIMFLICMCLLFVTDRLTLFPNAFKNKYKFSFNSFEKVSYVILAVVVLINIRNLHMTDFLSHKEEMYDIRAELRNKIVGGSFVVYIVFWMKCVILPVLLIHSLNQKKFSKVLLALFGSMLMFMIDQQKLTFIMPIVTIILYYIMKTSPLRYKKKFHVIIILSLIIFPFLLYSFKDESDLIYEIAAIFIMRTQCCEGVLLNTYLSFFGHDGLIHPYTYYSHIGIVNAITQSYPYDTSLGVAVTFNGANANGCSWLMDGIAAAGIYGVIISTLLLIVVKCLFNGCSQKVSVQMFSVITLFAMSMLVNVSTFTALFSCGFILLYLLLILVDFSGLRL